MSRDTLLYELDLYFEEENPFCDLTALAIVLTALYPESLGIDGWRAGEGDGACRNLSGDEEVVRDLLGEADALDDVDVLLDLGTVLGGVFPRSFSFFSNLAACMLQSLLTA